MRLIDADALEKDATCLYSTCSFKPIKAYTQAQIDAAPTVSTAPENKALTLPCNIGEMVYWISPFGTIYQGIVDVIKTSKFGFELVIQGIEGGTNVHREFERVFLTREAAERVLAALRPGATPERSKTP